MAAGDENLFAVPDRQQPRNAIDGRSEVVAIALVARSGVQCNPHAQPVDRGEIFGGQCALRVERRCDRIFSPRENRTKGIADRLEDAAAVRLDRACIKASCRRSASPIATRSRSQRTVLPSTSGNAKVTVPVGTTPADVDA